MGKKKRNNALPNCRANLHAFLRSNMRVTAGELYHVAMHKNCAQTYAPGRQFKSIRRSNDRQTM